MKYAHENGCPWDERTCAYSSENGHLDCLRYAHENGCPWDSGTTHKAAINEHYKCFVYAIQNGCPFYSRAKIPKFLKRYLGIDLEIFENCVNLFGEMASELRQRGRCRRLTFVNIYTNT